MPWFQWKSWPLLLAVLAAPVFSWSFSKLTGIESLNLFWLWYHPETLVVSVVLFPLIEEISFRGIVQGALLSRPLLRKSLWGITGANGIASAMFVGVHFVHHSPEWALMMFFPSLVFGYFRDKTSGVSTSVCLHMFYNLTFLSIAGQ